ncbi:MAG: hypothetical protein LBV16_07980 [Elusimicrobiota bacterium]|jgi:hypothetical protein|nr:hypothetical protein [Elusimicrobiota bacterium]
MILETIISSAATSIFVIGTSMYIRHLFKFRGFLLYKQRVFKNIKTDIEYILIAIWNPVESSVFWYQVTKDFINKIENPDNYHLEVLDFTDRRVCGFLKEQSGKVLFTIEKEFPAKSGFIALLTDSPFPCGRINNKQIVNSDVFIKNTRIGFMILIICGFILLSFLMIDYLGIGNGLSIRHIIVLIVVNILITGYFCWMGDSFIKNRFCMPKPLQDVFDGKVQSVQDKFNL